MRQQGLCSTAIAWEAHPLCPGLYLPHNGPAAVAQYTTNQALIPVHV